MLSCSNQPFFAFRCKLTVDLLCLGGVAVFFNRNKPSLITVGCLGPLCKSRSSLLDLEDVKFRSQINCCWLAQLGRGSSGASHSRANVLLRNKILLNSIWYVNIAAFAFGERTSAGSLCFRGRGDAKPLFGVSSSLFFSGSAVVRYWAETEAANASRAFAGSSGQRQDDRSVCASPFKEQIYVGCLPFCPWLSL